MFKDIQDEAERPERKRVAEGNLKQKMSFVENRCAALNEAQLISITRCVQRYSPYLHQ
jgi:hypothetical protein